MQIQWTDERPTESGEYWLCFPPGNQYHAEPRCRSVYVYGGKEMNMFEPQRTTEDLFAVPTDASQADKLNIHKDVLICKGTIVWACDVQEGRWVITVESEGHRRQFVSVRNPFGVTKGERLGPKFAIYEAVKVKQGHLLAGKRGMVVGYTKVDTYRVQIAGKMHVIGGEVLSPSKAKR